ncbi:MAG: hypothetical protein LBU04_07085 [Christensenellaceae bacterium]|jgi:hypothetical protein|nr:hypothetical protein [Christensenellaceae bacterium]
MGFPEELTQLKTTISNWFTYNKDTKSRKPWILWNTKDQETRLALDNLIDFIGNKCVTVEDLQEMIPVGSRIYTNDPNFNPTKMKIYPGTWTKLNPDIYTATATVNGEQTNAGTYTGNNITKITREHLPSEAISVNLETPHNDPNDPRGLLEGQPTNRIKSVERLVGKIDPNAIHDRSSEVPPIDKAEGMCSFPGSTNKSDVASISNKKGAAFKEWVGGHEAYVIDARHYHKWTQNIHLGSSADFDKQPKRIYKIIWEKVSK